MQINDIQKMMLAGVGKNNQINTSISGTGTSESIKDHTKTDALRDVSVKNPFYNKNDLDEKTVAESFSDAENSGLSAKELKEQMVLSSEHMTEEVYGKAKEDGHDPMDMDRKDFVTIADKIRVSLAKGGMDISTTGGVSDSAIEAMGGSAMSSAAIDKAVDNATKKAAEYEEKKKNGYFVDESHARKAEEDVERAKLEAEKARKLLEKKKKSDDGSSVIVKQIIEQTERIRTLSMEAVVMNCFTSSDRDRKSVV